MTETEPLLKVEGLTRRFGGLVAVNGLSMTVGPSEIVGLIGPNGSGKTTALNLLSGALKPDSGAIRLAGKAIDGLPAHKIARLGLARTFQLVRVLSSLDCVENVKAGLAFRERPLWGEAATEEAIRLLRRVGLGGKVDHAASQLTYIDQKRLELARALALAPKLLLLDEWLAGLNPSELQDGIALIHSLRDEGLVAARRGARDHPGGARHGRHPFPVRPMRGDERRNHDRSRSACFRPGRRRGHTGLSGRSRCLRSRISPSPTGFIALSNRSTCASADPRSWSSWAPTGRASPRC
jgi:branched-chain amino acid transport system ATP-binding protein